MFRRHLRRGKEGSAPSGEGLRDESLRALAEELSALGRLQVPQAAKERGWATLARELERRPVRPVAGQAKRTVRPVRTWRWAIASAAATIAVIAGVLGAYGGGAFNTIADDGHVTTVTSVASFDTTQPGTTGTTVTPSTTGTQPSTTSPQTDTTGSQPTAPITTEPSTDTSQPRTSTTQPRTTTTHPGTSTTQPGPSTTVEQIMAAKERVESAVTAATYLADLVISGNTSGASALVEPQAQSLLAKMMMSLKAPYGWNVIDSQTLTDGTVRVTLGIQDRVSNGQGGEVEKTLRFAIRVRVTAKGAVITAINAG